VSTGTAALLVNLSTSGR